MKSKEETPEVSRKRKIRQNREVRIQTYNAYSISVNGGIDFLDLVFGGGDLYLRCLALEAVICCSRHMSFFFLQILRGDEQDWWGSDDPKSV